MASFRKMQLVSEEEMNRLRQKQVAQYDPELRTASFLQQEIDQLLHDTHLEPEQKLRLFQMAQQRFTAIRGKEHLEKLPLEGVSTKMYKDEPAPVPQAQAAQAAQGPALIAPAAPQNALESLPAEHRHLLRSVPQGSKVKAAELIQHINRSNVKFEESPQGELVVDGQPLIGSNYQDLIYSLYSRKKDFIPVGIFEFLNALSRANMPRRLISNPISKFIPNVPSLPETPSLSSSHPAEESLSPSEQFHTPKEKSKISSKWNPYSYMFPGKATSPPRKAAKPPGKKPRVLSVYP